MCGYGGVKIRIHSGCWTWLSKTQCALCRIKADCVRPVHLWGTNRYWPKVPGNTNQLIDSTTSCWETWLPFSARWGAAALASRCAHVSQRALAKQIDWPRWTKQPGVLQVVPEIAGPDRLWLFPLGVREGQSLCTSTTRNRGWAAGTHHCSCQLVTPDMLQRVWSELEYRIDVCRVTKGGHIECVWYHVTLFEFMQL